MVETYQLKDRGYQNGFFKKDPTLVVHKKKKKKTHIKYKDTGGLKGWERYTGIKLKEKFIWTSGKPDFRTRTSYQGQRGTSPNNDRGQFSMKT